ncbi:MAG: hypothetical protein K2H26_02630, partial [Ruminococcus sp.]|nr:hypothetical protein [Ruminococcus sp.]
MSLKDPIPCKVTIFSGETEIYSKSVTLYSKAVVDANKDENGKIKDETIKDTESVGTDYIANGNYTVRVEAEAEGFVPFEQDIDNLSNSVCTLKVTLGFNPVYSYKNEPQTDSEGRIKVNADGDTIYKERKSKDHPGVLVYGDLNNDKEIDSKDIDLLSEAINTYVRLAETNDDKEKSTLNTKITDNKYDKLQLDWNDDKKVTIEDIGAFTQNYNEIKVSETYATPEQTISDKYIMDNVKVEDVKGNVTGSLDQLIQDSMSDDESKKPTEVKLQPTNGGTISEKNPVGFALPI